MATAENLHVVWGGRKGSSRVFGSSTGSAERRPPGGFWVVVGLVIVGFVVLLDGVGYLFAKGASTSAVSVVIVIGIAMIAAGILLAGRAS